MLHLRWLIPLILFVLAFFISETAIKFLKNEPDSKLTIESKSYFKTLEELLGQDRSWPAVEIENEKKIKEENINLSKINTPIVIVNFWASWCAPCLEEIPSLIALQAKYPRNKLQVVGVNIESYPQEKKYKIIKLCQKYKINYPVILDYEGKMSDQFKVSTLPMTIIYVRGEVKLVEIKPLDFTSSEITDLFKSL